MTHTVINSRSLRLRMDNIQITGGEVCYPPYGCYTDDAPFDINWVSLPQSPKYIGTKFMLYTRKQQTNPDILDDQDASTIRVSTFNGTKKTVIMAHGYLGKTLSTSNKIDIQYKASQHLCLFVRLL